MLIMAGVFGLLIRPQKKAMYRDPKAMELETAKEILADGILNGIASLLSQKAIVV